MVVSEKWQYRGYEVVILAQCSSICVRFLEKQVFTSFWNLCRLCISTAHAAFLTAKWKKSHISEVSKIMKLEM